MLGKSKVMAFAATTKPREGKQFYEKTLGMKLVEDSPFALVFDAGGTMLRVQKVKEHTPANHTLLGWDLSDISICRRTNWASGKVHRARGSRGSRIRMGTFFR